jgi:hypothetical protein
MEAISGEIREGEKSGSGEGEVLVEGAVVEDVIFS